MEESDTFIIHYDTDYELNDYEVEEYGDARRKEEIEDALHHKIKTEGGEVMSKKVFYQEWVEPVKGDMRHDTEQLLESLTGEDVNVNEIKIKDIEAV